MLPLIPIAIGGAVVAGLSVLCSSWEEDNEEAEAELEETRARYARAVRNRKARLLRNRKMKIAMLNYAATKKQLGFAERAAKVVRGYMNVGSERLTAYKDDMQRLIRNEVRIPAQADAFAQQYLLNVDDMASTYRKCRRQVSALRKKLDDVSNEKFYFTCARCHRRFAVKVGDLSAFKETKVNGKSYCPNCR